MLLVKDLVFRHGQKEILSNIHLSLPKGGCGVLYGASGCGKTTLFKLLAGIFPPTEGAIETFSEECPAYMAQEDLLLPWRTALGNVMLTGELNKKNSPKKTLEKAKELLKEVGLCGYEGYYPHELSGGMRKRVSLARALLKNSSILLLDEPFSSLDIALKEQLTALIKKIQKEKNLTLLMISHDLQDVALADKVFLMASGHIVKTWDTKEKKDQELIADLRVSLFEFYHAML